MVVAEKKLAVCMRVHESIPILLLRQFALRHAILDPIAPDVQYTKVSTKRVIRLVKGNLSQAPRTLTSDKTACTGLHGEAEEGCWPESVGFYKTKHAQMMDIFGIKAFHYGSARTH